MNTNLNTDVYNADIYLRLSREDGDKEESDSITNQKELILEFLKSRKDIRVHAIRADDGYSGVNFDRPAFQQMLEDIKNGKVNCVITKDLSRFGRNHIEVIIRQVRQPKLQMVTVEHGQRGVYILPGFRHRESQLLQNVGAAEQHGKHLGFRQCVQPSVQPERRCRTLRETCEHFRAALQR